MHFFLVLNRPHFGLGKSRLWACIAVAWLIGSPAFLNSAQVVTRVETGKVREQQLSRKLDFSGSLEAFQQIQISSKGRGQIIRMHVEEGQSVTKGQPLFELDSREDRIALARAQAELEKAQFEFEKLKSGYQPQEIEETKRRMAASEAVLTAAKDEWERTTQLAEQGIAAASELGKARSEYDVAIAQLSQARARLALIESGFRFEDIQIAQSEVKVRRAQVSDIQRQLEDQSTLAPFDSIIAARLKEEQEWTNEGDPILVMLVLNPMKLRVEAPQRNIVFIRPGQMATVTVPGLEGEIFEAKVIQIIPQAQIGSRNFPVVLQMDNKDRKLAAGMYAKVHLEIDEKPMVLTLPREAIQYREQKLVVYRVDPTPKNPTTSNTSQELGKDPTLQDSMATEVEVAIVSELERELVIEAKHAGDLWDGCEVVVMGGTRLTGGAPLHRLMPTDPVVRAN
ncbi:MAG: efflux RND transporter periplasmic adaptor subunit [Verrucomicrobia bacterium]|nr:efflux RND transporter periplasmic adaptor subunit [Verrucomicrobiota bacterium]